MGLHEWLKQVRHDLEEKVYKDEPEKLRQRREGRARRDAALEQGSEPPDIENMSLDDLRLLRLDLEREVVELQKRNSSYRDFVDKGADSVRAKSPAVDLISGAMKSLAEAGFGDEIRKKQGLLDRVKLKIEQSESRQLSPAEEAQKRLEEEVSLSLELETALRQKAEELKRKHPDQAAQIDRLTRREIDAIREEHGANRNRTKGR